MKKIKAYESKTVGGQRGLFSAGRLITPLGKNEDAKKVAKKLGYGFIEGNAIIAMLESKGL